MIAIKEKVYELTISKSAIWVFYTICYVVIDCLPVVKYSVPYVVAGLFSLIPLIIVAFYDQKYCKLLVMFCILGFIHGFLYFVNGYATWTEIINEPIRCIRYFIPCVLFDKLCYASEKKKVLVWLFITVLFLFVAISTLVGVSQNPMLARLLATGESMSEEIAAYRFQNAAGFEFCYALSFTTPLWTYLLVRGKSIMKFLTLFPLLFVFYFALQVQYMTLLLICIASIFLVLLFCAKGIFKKISAILISAIILVLLPTIMREIANSGVEYILRTKLNNMADVLEGKLGLGDTTSRTELYFKAFETFLTNPFVGSANSDNVIKAHSTIFGTLASTGLIGSISIFYGMYFCCSQTVILLKKKANSLSVYNICIVLFVILMFVNPIHYAYEISIVMFLYIPLTMLIFKPRLTVK